MNFITKITIGIIAVLILSTFLYTFFYNKTGIENTEKINPNKEISKTEFKIIAFGDSLTAGLGVKLNDSYPSILENILNTDPEYVKYNRTFKVVNMGVSGETSSGGRDRVDFVIEQKPDLILLGVGANDMFRNADPDLVLSNIDAIVQKILSSKTPLILFGMQSVASNGREYKKKFDTIYPTLARKYSLPLVPFILKDVALKPSLNIPDGIHPNRLGYEEIVNKNILPTLDSSLKMIIDF